MITTKESSLRRITKTVYANKGTFFSLLIFIIMANLFAVYFIGRERFIYYWDCSCYWKKYWYLCSHIFEPIQLVKSVIFSIRVADYNDLPALLLMPFGILFGTSRMAYILSIVNLFAIPVVVSFVLLHKKLCRIYGITSAALPFISAGIILLSPNFWIPILSGYPDVGGLFLINLIFLIYLNNEIIRQRLRDYIIVALFVTALFLFRRWYAYWGVSFYAASMFQAFIISLCMYPFGMKKFIKVLLRIFALITVSAIFLFMATPDLAIKILRTNYADIYSAYKVSRTLFQSAKLLLNPFGILYSFPFVLGAFYGIFNKRTRDFSILLISQLIIIFLLFTITQDFGYHHSYLMLSTILLFSSLCITNFIFSIKKLRIFACIFIILIFVLNFFTAFSPNELLGKTKVSKIFSGIFTDIRHPPMVRNDIKEICRILNTLNVLAVNSDDNIYVLASSHVLNFQVLKHAYLSFNCGNDVSGKILFTNDVDKRDGLPRHFFTAKYVVVAFPVQYHLHPSNQRIVGIPAELILEQKGIGRSFEKLPYEFTLDKGVKVYIYKKVKAFNDSDLEALSGMLKAYYPLRENICSIYNETETKK